MDPPMSWARLPNRWFIASFHGLVSDGIEFSPTNVAIVERETLTLVCDTYLGPGSMSTAWQQFAREGGDVCKPVLVFNSHSDWDHHWGNCFFHGAIVVGHEHAARAIRENGARELAEHGHLATGDVILTPPSKTFEKQFNVDDEITLFHAPGHTPGSSACYDARNGVLFAGDDVEDPVPWLTTADIPTYIDTLEAFLALEPVHVIPGHGSPAPDSSLVSSNLAYLRALERGHDAREFARLEPRIHEHNLDVLASS